MNDARNAPPRSFSANTAVAIPVVRSRDDIEYDAGVSLVQVGRHVVADFERLLIYRILLAGEAHKLEFLKNRQQEERFNDIYH